MLRSGVGELPGYADEDVEPENPSLLAYKFRMAGTGITLHDGFGWNSTTGLLDGANNTQAQSGTIRSYGNWFETLAQACTPSQLGAAATWPRVHAPVPSPLLRR